MNVARVLASVIVVNGHIHVAGGENVSNDDQLNSVESYDPKSDEWIQLAPMKKKRACFVLKYSNRFLYAMGYHKVIERYDPWKQSWTEVRKFIKIKNLN